VSEKSRRKRQCGCKGEAGAPETMLSHPIPLFCSMVDSAIHSEPQILHKDKQQPA
jgi:hypothetical protein